MQHTLNVTIDSGILPTLVDGKYKLCIAKKVNDQYTVVWQGSTVLFSNDFAWSTDYRIYGSIPFQSGALVRATTEKQTINSGQTATLQANGVLAPSAGATDTSGVFYFNNQYGLINVGIDAQVNGSWAPIYASENPVVTGVTTLQPIEKIMVWFDTSLTTGSMMLEASSAAIEIPYSGATTSHTLTYRTPAGATAGNGVWILDETQPVLTSTYSRSAHKFTIDQPTDGVISLMTDFLNNRTSLRTPLPPASTSGVTVNSHVVYDIPADAKSFAQYAQAHRPKDFATWGVSVDNNTVNIKMEPQATTDEHAAISHLQDTYLGVLYGFQGAKYADLTFEIDGTTAPAQSSGPDPKTTATAIVQLSSPAQAAAFVKQVNAASSADIKYAAAANGVAVTIRFSVLRPKDVVQDRANVQKGYDSVISAFKNQAGGGDAVFVSSLVWDEQ